MRPDRLGAADGDAGESAAMPGMPIDQPRLALGGDDIGNEASPGRKACP